MPGGRRDRERMARGHQARVRPAPLRPAENGTRGRPHGNRSSPSRDRLPAGAHRDRRRAAARRALRAAPKPSVRSRRVARSHSPHEDRAIVRRDPARTNRPAGRASRRGRERRAVHGHPDLRRSDRGREHRAVHDRPDLRRSNRDQADTARMGAAAGATSANAGLGPRDLARAVRVARASVRQNPAPRARDPTARARPSGSLAGAEGRQGGGGPRGGGGGGRGGPR